MIKILKGDLNMKKMEVKKVGGGVDNKVTCSKCGRRRYGATYEVGKKKNG